MSSTAQGFRQDMPPKGGYGQIQYEKGFVKPKWSGYTKFGLKIAFTIPMWYIFVLQHRYNKNLKLEALDARIATYPIVQAEADRIILSQLRKNRDAEEDLMKNVPNWTTGTYYGKPVYHNVSNRFKLPSFNEYYAHCNRWKLPKQYYAN